MSIPIFLPGKNKTEFLLFNLDIHVIKKSKLPIYPACCQNKSQLF